MSNALTTTNGSDSVTELLMRAATDPGFDSNKFETAVAFVREREAKADRRAYNEAMARISERLDAIPKTGNNTYARYKYATLDGMLSMIKPIAAEYGVGIRFGSRPPSKPGLQCVTCVTSLGAHEETTELEGPTATPAPSRDGKTQMTPIQAIGSTTTYLKKYLVGMVFSLVLADEQDDDGEATRQKAPPQSAPVDRRREEINREVPLKGEAQRKMMDDFERGDLRRKEDEASQAFDDYNALADKHNVPIELLGADTARVWMDNIERMLASAPTREYVEVVGSHPSVIRATSPSAPAAVREKVNDMLADAMGRFPNEKWTEPPEDDEAPEIVGQDKIMAG